MINPQREKKLKVNSLEKLGGEQPQINPKRSRYRNIINQSCLSKMRSRQ